MRQDPISTGWSLSLRPLISNPELRPQLGPTENKLSFIISISGANPGSLQPNQVPLDTNEAWRWILSRLIQPYWVSTGSITSEVSGPRRIGSTTKSNQ